MKQRFLLLVLAVVAAQCAFVEAQAVKVINVRNFGCAGNGVKDDSACVVAAGKAAIDAAASGPVELYFPAGRYMINPLAGMETFKPGATGGVFLDFAPSHASNVTIQGDGDSSQLALLPYTASPHPTQPYNAQVGVVPPRIFYAVLIRFAGNNESVHKMTFDGNGQGYGADLCKGTPANPYGCFWISGIVMAGKKDRPLEKLYVSHNRFLKLPGWPVMTTNTAHVRIANNQAEESEGMVCSNGSSDCIIDQNSSTNSHDAPYACNGGTGDGQQVADCFITNNTASVGNNGAGIDVTGAWNATVTGNTISGSSNWCIQVTRSGGTYRSNFSTGLLPSRDVLVKGNTCLGNNHWEGWPLNGEILVGDVYECPKSGEGKCWTGPYTPGATAKNVTVVGNHCSVKNGWGTCVVVGFGALDVTIEGNEMTGCGTRDKVPRSIWIDGGATTARVRVGQNTLQSRAAGCMGQVYH
ncbi:MAG: glycosyl hydrolase family 28-related protein [Terracidiphilus sp.]